MLQILRKKNIKKENKSNQVEEKQLLENTNTILSLVLPDGIQEGKDYVYNGANKYSRYFVLDIFPREIYIGWLDDLFAIGEIGISVLNEPVSKGSVINKLTNKIVKLRSEYQVYTEKGNIYHLPALEQSIGDLEQIRANIQTNRDRLYYSTILISLHAKSIEELAEKTLILEEELSKKSAQIRCLIFRQLEAQKSMLPIGYEFKGYERNITTGGLTASYPIANPDITHPKGAYIGRNMFTNSPVYFDNFIGPTMLNNPHMTVFRHTRFTVNRLHLNYLREEMQYWVLKLQF